MIIRTAFVLVLLAAAGVAQTFVVDAAGGPGANFTNLQTAVNAVPDGAILLIRPGSYGLVSINGKGLSLLATAPGVNLGGGFILTPILVQNLAAAQALTLRGLSITFGGATQIDLRSCAGPVLIDDFHFDTSVTSGVGHSNGIAIDRCAQVAVRNSRILAVAAISASQSTVAIESCELIGANAINVGEVAGTGVAASSSSVTFARCQVRGGNGNPFTLGLPAPAIRCNGAQIRICDDGNGSYTAGLLLAGTPTAAVDGPSGTVVRDPSAVLAGSSGGGAVGGSIVDIVRPLPSLRTVSAPGALQADVTTPAGELVLLAFGLQGSVTTVPGIDGNLWLDLGTTTLVALGIPQPGAPLQHSIAVPPGLALIGLRVAWQALAYSAVDGLRFGNPSIQTL